MVKQYLDDEDKDLFHQMIKVNLIFCHFEMNFESMNLA
jgi:hypothetical protein